MNIIIVINTDNTAFANSPAEDVARKLSQENDASHLSLRDINGNTVGYLAVEE